MKYQTCPNCFGLASSIWEPCIWPYPGSSDGEFKKGTIILDPSLANGFLDELSPTVGARETLIHELGHTFGMKHENNTMSIMCNNVGPCGKFGAYSVDRIFGGHTESMQPDDVLFMERWQASSGFQAEVAASGWTHNGTSVVLNHPSLQVLNLCPGQTFQVTSTRSNKCIATVTDVSEAIVFSLNSPRVSFLSRVAATFVVTMPVGSYQTFTDTITVPSLRPRSETT